MNKATIREVECTKETEKALLVTDHAGFEEWIPKSAVHEDSEVYSERDEGDLVLKSWKARELGIELD